MSLLSCIRCWLPPGMWSRLPGTSQFFNFFFFIRVEHVVLAPWCFAMATTACRCPPSPHPPALAHWLCKHMGMRVACILMCTVRTHSVERCAVAGFLYGRSAPIRQGHPWAIHASHASLCWVCAALRARSTYACWPLNAACCNVAAFVLERPQDLAHCFILLFLLCIPTSGVMHNLAVVCC